MSKKKKKIPEKSVERKSKNKLRKRTKSKRNAKKIEKL